MKGDDARGSGESESLSDIDDAELDSYLNNEKEKQYKKIIWEKLNQKYLQEQEAKKAAGAAHFAKPKKEQRQKRTTGMKKTQPAAEVADPASSKRRSSRINYDVLSKILDEPLPSDGSKKRRTESDSDQNSGKDSSPAPLLANDEPSAADENEEDGWEDPEDYSYYGNQEEEYNEYDFPLWRKSLGGRSLGLCGFMRGIGTLSIFTGLLICTGSTIIFLLLRWMGSGSTLYRP